MNYSLLPYTAYLGENVISIQNGEYHGVWYDNEGLLRQETYRVPDHFVVEIGRYARYFFINGRPYHVEDWLNDIKLCLPNEEYLYLEGKYGLDR